MQKNILLALVLAVLTLVMILATMPQPTTLIITSPEVYAASSGSSSSSYTVTGQPTISVAVIARVLCNAHSPACGTEQSLYTDGVKYGIDPAFALAFFQHESGYGLAGEARVSLSLGNLRCIPGYPCRDGYAWFPSWESGFEAWYKLISVLYVAEWHLTTIEQIIPKYAPSADHNDEHAYIQAVETAVDSYRSM